MELGFVELTGVSAPVRTLHGSGGALGCNQYELYTEDY